MRARGFTLLEIIIAVAILSFISMYTAQAIQRSIRAKKNIQRDIDRNSQVRDALQVIANDIRMAFNYRDIAVDIYNLAQQERTTRKPVAPASGSAATATPPTPQEPFKPRETKVVTGFIGDKESVTLTTVSYFRTIKDSKVSDQVKIGYFLKNCSNRVTKSMSSNCLWRRVDHNMDGDLENGGDETVLIENVESFELRYLDPVANPDPEWKDAWKSMGTDEEGQKDNFPAAVEISIKVADRNSENDKAVAMTAIAPIPFPNNPSKEDKDAAAAGAGTKPN